MNEPTKLIDVKLAINVMAVAFLLLGMFTFLVLYSHSYDPAAFILSGTQFRLADSQGTKGYDGQFAYYIASDPLSAYRYMDEPGKRYQRILFPILAWILSFGGNPGAIPWVMLGINLLAVVMTTGILVRMIAERHANPWFALVYIFYIGVLFSIRADLNEPLAMMLSLAGWYAYQKRWIKLSLVCFMLAGLGKEIGLIFPFAIAMWELMGHRWRKAVQVLFFSILPFGAIFIILQLKWGNSTESLLPNWIPFSGIVALQDRVFLGVVAIWALFPMAILAIILLRDFLKKDRAKWNLEAFMLIINVIFLSIMPYKTWEDPLAVLRSAIPFFIAALIWMAQNHKRLLPYAAALWAPSNIILFLIPGMVY